MFVFLVFHFFFFFFADRQTQRMRAMFDISTAAVRARVFEEHLKSLGALMMLKYVPALSAASLWHAALESFVAVVPLGFTAIRETGRSEIESNVVWTELVDIAQSYLLHEGAQTADESDLALVRCLAHVVLPESRSMQLIPERIFDILIECTKSKRRLLVESSWRLLCELAQNDKNALLVVVKQTEHLLQHFAYEKADSSVVSEACFVLEQLAALHVDTSFYAETGKQGHLCELFLALTECIGRDGQVDERIKVIFRLIAQQPALQKRLKS
jgi:hypothetical protein